MARSNSVSPTEAKALRRDVFFLKRPRTDRSPETGGEWGAVLSSALGGDMYEEPTDKWIIDITESIDVSEASESYLE